jgi:hypothetical protein
VAPTYAPAGQALVSVTVLGLPDGDVEASVRKQLLDWFGPDVNAWRHLRTYRIPYALPSQAPPALSPVEKSATRGDHLFVCGDYLDTASIQGAMVSGRRAAECVMQNWISIIHGSSTIRMKYPIRCYPNFKSLAEKK